MAFRYLLFHKPFHVLSQFSPGKEGSAHPNLSRYISVRDVYPVGRLDYDSEGLLLLTNDGPLQHRLSDPKFEHPRTYWAQVEGSVTEGAIQQLAEGVLIQGRRTKPCQARIIAEPLLPPRNPPIRFRANIPASWLEIVLTEGRNRQVRRMTAAVGFPTLRLVRAAIGELNLEELGVGCWRDLTRGEIDNLRRAFFQRKKRQPHVRPPFSRFEARS